MTHPLNRVLIALLALVGLGLAVISFLYWTVFFPIPIDLKQQPFDQAVWVANPCERVRQTMTADLEATLLKPGTPRAEIEALLGQPYQGGIDPNHGDYCLGEEPVLFPIDDVFLILDYSANGTLIGAHQSVY